QTATGKESSNPFMAVSPPIYISCIKQFWNTAAVKRTEACDCIFIDAKVSADAARGFEQIIDFLSGSYIHHALTVNPHVYISCINQFWNTAVVKRSGVICLPNDEIFAGLARMGYEKPSTKLTFYKAFFSTQWKFFIHTILHSLSAKRTSWNEFSSAMASVLICLSSGQMFNFSKYIFESLDVPPTPTSPLPSSPVIPSLSPHQSPCPPQPQAVKGSSHVFQQVLDTCSALVLRVEGGISVDMETDKGVELVVDQEKNAEVVAASIPISAAKPKVLKIAAAPAVSTRRRKGVVIRDPKEELHTDTPAETPTVKDKGKGILIEDPKPVKKKDQIEMDAEYAKKLQEELDKEHEEAYK
nr:hypothetical protein [Tanacetum cinerariifolium]